MEARVGIGIDFGSTNIKGAILDETGRVYATACAANNGAQGYDQAVRDLIALVEKLLNDAGRSSESVAGLGVACPGLVDVNRGLMVYHPGFEWKNKALQKDLAARFPELPVRLINDGNAAAYGEMRLGAAAGKKNVVLLTLGSGVGGGIIVNGEILNGRDGFAGEIGHMIVEMHGETCCCGRQGCLETYSAARGLTAYARQQRMRKDIATTMSEEACGSIKTIAQAADQGDPLALHIMERLYAYLSGGIVSLIHIVNPESVVLSGGIANLGEGFLTRISGMVEEKLMYPLFRCEIRIAALGENAGIFGACLFGLL